MKPITLLTKRLQLRSAKKNDSVFLFQNYCSDIYCSKFLTRKPHESVEQTEKFLNKWCVEAWNNEANQFAWVIAQLETDEPIGVFLVEVDDHKAQIHYGISRLYNGKGLITEAGDAVIHWLTSQSDLQRIWAVCDLDNYGSIRVLEKLNFTKEGILRKWLNLPSFESSTARDCYIFSRI